MLKVLMHEDKQSLEISCDCDEDSGIPSDANKIVFSLNPQLSPSPTINSAEPIEDKSEFSPGKEVPVAFVVRVWTRENYLIIQINDNCYVVFASNGRYVGTGSNPDSLINDDLSSAPTIVEKPKFR